MIEYVKHMLETLKNDSRKRIKLQIKTKGTEKVSSKLSAKKYPYLTHNL